MHTLTHPTVETVALVATASTIILATIVLLLVRGTRRMIDATDIVLGDASRELIDSFEQRTDLELALEVERRRCVRLLEAIKHGRSEAK